MSSLSNQRLAALADWSGLRPLSEMEFEKACRGYNTPAVPNEYVWGNTTLNSLSTVTNTGLSNEAVSTPSSANANLANSFNQITRTGIFARSSGSDRTISGGTYYGVMNMGDNTAEICFTIANAQGRAEDGAIHGDGYLAASGNTDISLWTPFQAYGVRGSAYNLPAVSARTSDRSQSNLYTSIYGADASVASNGGRMARTAP
jgi:formylglycine-generating enzyme required for sulfatase activity